MRKNEDESSKGKICRCSDRLLGALYVFLCLVSPVWAQMDSTALTGTVIDFSGKALPDVEVTAVQDATGLQRKATSSADGAYYFPKLPVGSYTGLGTPRQFQLLFKLQF